jgi:putative transposase
LQKSSISQKYQSAGAHPYTKFFSYIREALGANRFVWNKLLEINLNRLEQKLPILWYQEMSWMMTLWKQSQDYAFLNQAPAQSLQQTAKALDRAFRDAFDKKQPNKRLPQFKRLNKREAGIKYPQHIVLDQGNSVIKIPKLGWVKYRNSRDVLGKIKNVTISRKDGQYMLSIQTERDVETPSHPSSTAVGIDLGIVSFATLSDGVVVAPKNSFKVLSDKLAKAQRKLKSKVKFSNNWKKQQKWIQNVHTKIAYVRQDFLHQTSNTISKNHAMIVMEDLKIMNMSKSASGTMEEPGRKVAQKSGLNRSILDQGWGEFRRQLEYKQGWRGGMVVYVDPKHTSQTCPICGHQAKENRLTQEEFRCLECFFEANADSVASQNILSRGLGFLH